jgi:hypothetical protein
VARQTVGLFSGIARSESCALLLPPLRGPTRLGLRGAKTLDGYHSAREQEGQPSETGDHDHDAETSRSRSDQGRATCHRPQVAAATRSRASLGHYKNNPEHPEKARDNSTDVIGDVPKRRRNGVRFLADKHANRRRDQEQRYSEEEDHRREGATAMPAHRPLTRA